MQHTLTFKHDNKKYVSKPFDFEAMCIINDAHNDENKNGPLNICREAVDYMFEGTDATQDIIDAIDVGTHSRLCMERVDNKKRVKGGNSSKSQPLRTLYADWFRQRGLLPNVISKQNPFVLFKMIADLEDDTEEGYTGNDPYLKMFYGM